MNRILRSAIYLTGVASATAINVATIGNGLIMNLKAKHQS